ncbi:ankyrin repeat domain-containing protein [Sphingomonas gilva]|uniref:Ankyrin repeat domain-containing protein n=1 Tax=Sphingomonas gilva TaxID=2305907 RepID=A0A396RZI6_9SPHN|nr:ankyrin repeat domain-containing protein [Sphingomonas gilva]RHW19161.1 ankyrin repeat domain-containing protein [Sphingomonas gilva]
MKSLKLVLACVAFSCAGMATAVFAGDPFEDAAVAVRWKEDAKALALIESGQFDINQQNSEGYTLLHFAADQNNLTIARALLKHGADPNIRTNSGSTVADMAYSGSALLTEVLKAGGKYAKNAPYTPAPQSKAPITRVKPAPGKPAASTSSATVDPRRKMCNARHYSSSSLCSDSTCKMREYRKWQTCLKTGSYH